MLSLVLCVVTGCHSTLVVLAVNGQLSASFWLHDRYTNVCMLWIIHEGSLLIHVFYTVVLTIVRFDGYPPRECCLCASYKRILGTV